MTKYTSQTGKQKELPQRKSIRLKGYDYSQAGLYFITICIQNRVCLLGQVCAGIAPSDSPEMILNDAGKMVEAEWLNLKARFPNIELHEYVVMPNHFHGILEIVPPVGATLVVAQAQVAQNTDEEKEEKEENGQPQGIAPTVDPTIAPTVGEIIAAFKSISTVAYIRSVKNSGWPPFQGKLWQRNYYEHIIRNEKSYENIAHYILNNPAKWYQDKFFNK